MIYKLRRMLERHKVTPEIIEKIMAGSESLTRERGMGPARQAFFVRAMELMDELLDFRTRCEVRNDCGCSKSGWREKAVREIARDYKDKGLAERIEALGHVKYMGNPVLHEDGTISGGVGTEGGFPCPCPEFKGWQNEQPVSPTYCLCCAGHFRYHYQIALGVKLQTKAVLSSSLESQGKKPCRFVFEVVEKPPRRAQQKMIPDEVIASSSTP